jgi:flagellar motor switch/type III secretory pathway protein FliN
MALLARLPARTAVTLGGLGRLEIRAAGVAPRDLARAELVSLGVGRPRVEGRVSVDVVLARALVQAALRDYAASPGSPPVTAGAGSSSVGPLGFSERGVLAGLIARVFASLEVPLVLALEAPSRGAPDMLVLALEISAVGVRGWAELEVPTRWLGEVPPVAPDGAALAALAVTARLELCRTFIGAADLAGLAEGDAVVFDGRPALDRVGDWPVTIVLGETSADASLSTTGLLEVRRSFRARAAHRIEEGTLTGDVADDTDDGRDQNAGSEVTARIDVTAVLAAVPVEVVAEVGRIVLRGDEVLGLAPGVVLSLGGPRVAEVTLRVGDQDWAEGELVDVEGALAVRVTRVVRPTASR